MTKEQSHVMLKLHNVRIKLSNVRKNKKKPSNVTKVQLHVILELHNVMIELSNVKNNNNKGTTECDKRTVTCNVRTT